VEGKLKNRSWQDKDGNTRYTTEVLGESMTLLTPRSESDRPAPTNTAPYPTEPSSNPSPLGLNANFEDDLPF
jgi:single-strand DNA-binding protein